MYVGSLSARQRHSPRSEVPLGSSERAPNRIIGDRPYRRSDVLARRRELMDAWHCEGAEGANVVVFKRAGLAHGPG
jgi:hypothetical protein